MFPAMTRDRVCETSNCIYIYIYRHSQEICISCHTTQINVLALTGEYLHRALLCLLPIVNMSLLMR